jgi:hypothetical protein
MQFQVTIETNCLMQFQVTIETYCLALTHFMNINYIVSNERMSEQSLISVCHVYFLSIDNNFI